MHNRLIRQSALLVMILMLVSLCLVEADGQTRRRRRPRRVNRPVVTNPVIAPPGEEQTPNTDPERIISTADETPTESGDPAQTVDTKTTPKKPGEEQEIKQTINALSNQVNRLNDKLSQMSENDKTLIDMERLTRAEQRSESLRSQQIDTEGKLADFQSQLEQVEFSLRPENIERAAGYGTTRPEEARDATRRALESRKGRLQAQIRILETSKIRLEQALVTADAEVDALRRRLEQQKQQEAVTPPATTEPRPANNRRPE